MPPRSKVEQLPEDVFEELKRRLVGSGFSDYKGHAEWLAGKGFEIRKSAVHNFGQGYEAEREAMKMSVAEAKMIVQEVPDEEGAMNDALQRLVSDRIYRLIREGEIDMTPKTLSTLARAIADLGRASIQQKRHMVEFQKKAGDVITDMAKATGMSADDAANWRARLIGVQVP
jgi:hypothetical protein